jgi:hypothetical protein
MQTPTRNESSVVNVSDSHLEGCTKRINNHLSGKIRMIGWITPGALAEEVLDSLTV